MGDETDGPGHHREAAGDAPGKLHLGGDGRDRAGRVDREVAAVGSRGLLCDELHERHHQGVEHHRLLLRGKPSLELEERDVAERDPSDQVRGQVVVADEDLVGRAAPEPGLELAAHLRTVNLVLYPDSPKSDSSTSSTLLRNISLEWIAFSISVTSAPSDSCRSVTSTSTGIGGSIEVSSLFRITRAGPVPLGRNAPTTARI